MEIESGVDIVNAITSDQVVEAIRKAKENGWELFPEEKLKTNMEEWRKALVQGLSGVSEKRLAQAENLARFFPLVHVVDNRFILPTLEKGHIPSLASRKGRGRTASYEMELGLGDFVFLSSATWRGASGIPIYFNPERIFNRDDTVVTIRDFSHLLIPFDESVRLYQQMAFTGNDFKELLPYFLLVHYDRLDKPSGGRAVPIEGIYPDWFVESFGNYSLFQPEIKVKDKLVLNDDCRILIPKSLEGKPWDLIREKFGERVISSQESRLKFYLDKGREWWNEEIE